jgi:hypothetical protein
MPAPKDPTKREAWLKKVRVASLGIKPSEETKRKLRESNIGQKRSLDTCKKISLSKKGKSFSEEHKKHMSEAHKGKEITAEQRRKIGAAHRGKIVSAETRRKISIAKKGKKRPPITEEHRRKLSEANKGENCYNWQDGISYEPYCPKFNKDFRDRVRAFFGYQCQMCGHVWKKGERRLHVHHVNFRKDACCNNEVAPLFVPLCTACHAKTQFNRVFWHYWFTEMINYLYDGLCYLPKQL